MLPTIYHRVKNAERQQGRLDFGPPTAEIKNMHPLVDRFRAQGAKKTMATADLRYILGLKWAAHTRAEINELAGLEDAFRTCGIPNLVLDKVESGYKDISFWFYVDNPKRAFKALSELETVSGRMKTLQAASADRTTMKFSVVYPK